MPQIHNTRHQSRAHGLKGLIYGKSGVGKTRLAVTAPNCLVIATEPGTLSLAHFDIPYIEARTVQQLYEVGKWIATSAEARQFQTFIFDSLTETFEIILAQERIKVGNKEPRKAYGELLIQGTELIKAYRDIAGPNIIFLAKQTRQQDGESGMMLYGPSFPGKALDAAGPYLFDFVFNLFIHSDTQSGQKHWLFRTGPNNQYEAKDRSGLLGEIEPANLDHIFRKISGER